MLNIVLAAQRTDPFVKGRAWRSTAERWAIDRAGLLRKEGKAYIPPSSSLRNEIMRTNHDDPHASHFGAGKTLALLRRHYFWDSMAADVRDYVRTCAVCQRTTVRRHHPYGVLASLPRP